MKTIKKFESFINEELDAETYLSAAEKLKQKGHKNRASKLKDYAKGKTKTVTPIEIELYDKKFKLTDKNIIVFKDGKDSDEIRLYVAYDRDYYDRISNNDYEGIWNNLPNKEKEEFHKEHQTLMEPEEWDKKVMNGEALNNNWSEMSDSETGFFKEWANMNQFMTGISTDTDTDKYDFDVDGLTIKDRKIALKLTKFLKEYANLYGGEVKKSFDGLTVNDLYYD